MQARVFYQTTKEMMSKWAQQISDVSTHLSDSQAKFFQHFANQGERIGAMTNEIVALEKSHEELSARFAEK